MAVSTVERNKSVVRRMISEFVNGGDEAAGDELFTRDYVRHEPNASETPQGVDAFAEMLREFRSAFPDAEVVIDEMLAEGDLVGFRGHERGTHEGEFMGVAPTGRSFEITGQAIHRVEEGKIAETWATWDRLSMLQQLGVVPESPAA